MDALLTARRGTQRRSTVSDPLGRPVEATWGIVEGGATAISQATSPSAQPTMNASISRREVASPCVRGASRVVPTSAARKSAGAGEYLPPSDYPQPLTVDAAQVPPGAPAGPDNQIPEAVR